MSSRSHYDYSLWPEHARPRRKRFSLKAVAATLTVLTVCGFAASMVYSEFTHPSDPKALVGRTWPLQHVTEPVAQVTPPASQAATAPLAETDAAKGAKLAPRAPVNAANRKVMPTIGTARAPSSETDGRGTPVPTRSVDTPAAPEIPAATPITPETASTDNPAEAKPVVAEKDKKPHKKVAHRNRQDRSNTAVVATQGYDQDGRSVTVYRRFNQPEGYNSYSPGGYQPNNYGYGTWRSNPYYAERPSGYRPY